MEGKKCWTMPSWIRPILELKGLCSNTRVCFSVVNWDSSRPITYTQTVCYLRVRRGSDFSLGWGQAGFGALSLLAVVVGVGKRRLGGAHLVQGKLHSLVFRVPFGCNEERKMHFKPVVIRFVTLT